MNASKAPKLLIEYLMDADIEKLMEFLCRKHD
jgi:hypothetical protein